MHVNSAHPWLALALTKGLAARLSSRLLRQFRSPEEIFRAPLRQLEACELPCRDGSGGVHRQARSAQNLRVASHEPRPIDDIVERTGLNSFGVLATLFDLEMKGFVRQLPGKQFSKLLL